uniref:SCAN domain-containing protein 3-like n=1 Tax=Erpetoichthys calabaricus TaxID=27687 RepID=A0A8C4RVL9_ERPCA
MADCSESRKRKNNSSINDLNENDNAGSSKVAKTKTRYYQDSYLNYGFTFVDKKGIQHPRCLLCGDILANEAMVPSKLQRHFQTKHHNANNKNSAYFRCLMDSQQKQAQLFMKTVSVSDKAQLASFEVAELVAMAMKPHTIVESLIMPACKIMVKTMLGDDAEKVISKMPSSNNTVSRRIEAMSSDINNNVCVLLQTCKRFALQINESTDVSGKSQLLAFVRFSNSTKMLEQFLFCKELIETKGEDVFKHVCTFFSENDLLWEWCVAICTDGAPSMTGKMRGFTAFAKRENPNIITTHCFIHREALVSKTLGTELQSVLDQVIKIVNFIKVHPVKCRLFEKLCKDMGSEHYTLLMHTEVRWLSRGKVLSRVYELRDELRQFFLNEQANNEFVTLLADPTWCSKLAYLVDIFEVLNALNSGMQGNDSNILSVTDKLQAFRRKLLMWTSEIETTYLICMFPRAVQADPGAVVLHDVIVKHLSQLGDNLQHYFPSLDIPGNDWTRNPFHQQLDLSNLQMTEKEQLLDIASDRTLQLKFKDMNLTEFWIMVEKERPVLGAKAVGILIPFCTTYLCEKAFSALTLLKTKHRGCLLSVENDLRVCLSTAVRARIDKLSNSLRSQPSH